MRGASKLAVEAAAASAIEQIKDTNRADVVIQFPVGVNLQRKQRQAMGMLFNMVRDGVGDQNIHRYGFAEVNEETNAVTIELRRYEDPHYERCFTVIEDER